MKNTIRQSTSQGLATPGKQRSYSEVVDFLDAHWSAATQEQSLSCIKQLDQAFQNPSQKLKTVLVAGTNGKSLTIHFTTQLLKAEGLTVGTFYSPHILTYNERFSLNNEAISNKTFTELANEVINTSETMGLTPNSFEILTMMALLYFKNNNIDVALLEVSEGGASNPTNICQPVIAAITRIVPDNPAHLAQEIESMLGIVKPGTIVISADQSKISLQEMLTITTKKGGQWAMPIRKLAAIPFEQIHGRCAALAERIAQTFVNNILKSESTIVAAGLLAKPEGKRGRPTLDAKRQAELNPRPTLEQFWKNVQCDLPARFQLLDKEKPSILLDSAQNLDAFENILLGIRLLHYQRPLKGLTIVLGCNNPALDTTEFLKQLRYFFKKTSGQVIVCPVEQIPGQKGGVSLDIEKLTNDIKSMKIKARSCVDFKEAFEAACKTVDERHGLVVVTGSPAVVSEYWRYKGMKKI